ARMRYRLAVFRFFTGTLHVSQKAVLVQRLGGERMPRFADYRPVDGGVDKALVYRPSHAVYEECRAGGFLSAEMIRIVQTNIPETVGPLQGHQRGQHVEQILLILIVMRIRFG